MSEKAQKGQTSGPGLTAPATPTPQPNAGPVGSQGGGASGQPQSNTRGKDQG